jgi:transcriptional regulator with XRE-family HTH domain
MMIMALGDVIKQILTQKEMSQGALATQSGVSKGHISAIIRGKKPNPSLETLRRICYALGITLAEIVDDSSSLIEVARLFSLSYEEYIRILGMININERPKSALDWYEIISHFETERYPGLYAFLKKANLKWLDVKSLINNEPTGGFPDSETGWEEWFRWKNIFK